MSASRVAKRAFQIAFYGATAARTVRALHARFGDGPLVEVPDLVERNMKTVFFDHEAPVGMLRLRALTGTPGAFMALFGGDAVVLCAASAAAKRELKEHFATYGAQPVLERRGSEDVLATIERELVRQRVPGRVMKPPSTKYLARAKALAAAVDVAAWARGGKAWQLELATKQLALHPDPGAARLSSLAHLETPFFTYWNEGTGRDVDAFWREIARRKLPFRRRDVVRESLVRGKISNRGDYETVIDLIGEPALSERDRIRLSKMIGAYEKAQST